MLSSGDYRCFFCLASLKLFACCFAMSNITLFVHRESVWFAIANGGGFGSRSLTGELFGSLSLTRELFGSLSLALVNF